MSVMVMYIAMTVIRVPPTMFNAATPGKLDNRSPDRDHPQEKSSTYPLPLPEPAGIGHPSSSARSPRKRSAGDL